MKTIYIVDDEANIRDLIKKYLAKEGFRAETFSGADGALEAMNQDKPDLFVLDITMPGMDGLELCREIRRGGNTPIIFVSARGEELDRVLGLELGADDYLSKPFSPRELVARIKSVLRRSAVPSRTRIQQLKELTFYTDERRVTVNGNEIEFTPKEYELLVFLAGNTSRAFSRDQLLDHIWGFDYVGDIRAVDDLVKRVRKKIKDSSVEIQTVWGYGYKLNAQA